MHSRELTKQHLDRWARAELSQVLKKQSLKQGFYGNYLGAVFSEEAGKSSRGGTGEKQAKKWSPVDPPQLASSTQELGFTSLVRGFHHPRAMPW